MRGDALVQNQRLLTQAVMAIANDLTNAVGLQFGSLAFAKLPATPQVGMVFCITDSTVNTWGSTVAGGGSFTVLAWYNGTAWKVIGA